MLFVAVLAGSALMAQPPGFPPGGIMRFNPLLSAIDTNHDGVISESEIAASAKSLLMLDKNGDGQITPDEMRPSFGPGGPGRPGGPGGPEGRRREEGPQGGNAADELVKTLMAFDKNGDGKLSKDELPERMQGMFARGDADHDGFLTVDEITRMAATQQQARGGGRGEERRGEGEGRGPGGPRRPDAVLAALDTNHDGTLSAEEIRNAPAALKLLDKNGDGKITEDEVRPNFPPRREE